MASVRPLISVCICTYRRPCLLDGLLNTIFNELDRPGPIELVVVDNDALGSASSVLNRYANRDPPLRHFLVPIQNISLARNRAVAEAHGTWIAMIDDDERPSQYWLTNLLRCAVDLDADVVLGPVLPQFPPTVPKWIVDGQFFERPRRATGTAVSQSDTRTGNVLMKADVLHRSPEPFDPDFGLSGGEDSLFFWHLLSEGRRLYWCDDAEVNEIVSEDRLSARWLTTRWIRTGRTFARIFLKKTNRSRSKLFSNILFILRSLILGFGACMLFLATIPFGKAICFKWMRVMMTQIGKISSFFC